MSNLDVLFDGIKIEKKLKQFGSAFGRIYMGILREVGDKMSDDARNLAPSDTGNLRNSINFLMRGHTSALSSRERFGQDSIRYAWAREHGSTVTPKDGKEFMTFQINGQWVRLRSFKSEPQPFMIPTYNRYFKGSNAIAYREIAKALQSRMLEDLQ